MKDKRLKRKDIDIWLTFFFHPDIVQKIEADPEKFKESPVPVYALEEIPTLNIEADLVPLSVLSHT